MPTDIIQIGTGSEVASLRALGEVRRRQSLIDRLVRERRETPAPSERRPIRRSRPAAPFAPGPRRDP